MFNFLYFLTFLKSRIELKTNRTEPIYKQSSEMKNLTLKSNYSTNLSEIYLCHFENGQSKVLNLTLSSRNSLKMLLNEFYDKTKSYNSSTQNTAKFEELKMSKINCNLEFDEKLSKQFIMSGNKLNFS